MLPLRLMIEEARQLMGNTPLVKSSTKIGGSHWGLKLCGDKKGEHGGLCIS